MIKGLQIRVKQESWNNQFDIAILQDGAEKFIAKPLEMEKISAGMLIQPCLSIDEEAAQQLFNELWSLGLRPKDGTGNSGHIEAMKYHLEDMRNLVFGGNKSHE